jgi:hypothetical protein
MEDAVMKGGAKPEKRDDVLAMAKKAYPEYEKPNALGTCGGQVKVAPTNSWGPPTPAAPAALKAQRQASAQALWPAPAPALKKTQDAELARIHKECSAYSHDGVDDFVHAHESPSPEGGYTYPYAYDYNAYGGQYGAQVHAPVQQQQQQQQPVSYSYY